MSYTIEQLNSMYCEDYDDQDGQEFSALSCSIPGRPLIIEEIADNLEAQVQELHRKYGKRVTICVYKQREGV